MARDKFGGSMTRRRIKLISQQHLKNFANKGNIIDKEYLKSTALIRNENGKFDLQGGNIINVIEPLQNDEIVNKFYVDNIFSSRETETEFQVNNKRVSNVREPEELADAVNLNYFNKNALQLNGNKEFDAKQCIISNVQAPVHGQDAMNLNSCTKLITDSVRRNLNNVFTIDKKQNKIDVQQRRLGNVGVAVEPDDVVTLKSLPPSIYLDIYNNFNASSRRISNVALPQHDSDVVTLGFLRTFIK